MRPMLLLAALPLAVAASPAMAQPACGNDPAAGTVRLDVSATQVRSSRGEMVFTLYPDDPRRFLAKGGKIARARTAARAGTTAGCFWVRPGAYAVVTYHDENGDGRFNRMLFIPKEGVGASNDPAPRLGAPRLDAVRFAVPAAGRAIAITTRYP